MSSRTAIAALILIALFGLFSFVFLGSRIFMIGAVVAILLVAVARIVRIWAPKSCPRGYHPSLSAAGTMRTPSPPTLRITSA